MEKRLHPGYTLSKRIMIPNKHGLLLSYWVLPSRIRYNSGSSRILFLSICL